MAAAGRPVSLPNASAMCTAPASKRQVTSFSFCAHVVEPVEHVEIALARHGEDVVDALRHQRVRQHAPADPRGHAVISCAGAPRVASSAVSALSGVPETISSSTSCSLVWRM